MTTPSNPDTLPQGTHIGRTALRVNDLDELTGFYRDVVGLGVLDETDTRSVLGVADTALLVLEGDTDAPSRHQSSPGLYHTAFRVPSRAALGDALARIRDRWQLGGASDHWVSEALYLTDLEENGIEIYRDYPREEWPIADDGRVRISTEPLDLASIEAAATEGVGYRREQTSVTSTSKSLRWTRSGTSTWTHSDSRCRRPRSPRPSCLQVGITTISEPTRGTIGRHQATDEDCRGSKWLSRSQVHLMQFRSGSQTRAFQSPRLATVSKLLIPMASRFDFK